MPNMPHRCQSGQKMQDRCFLRSGSGTHAGASLELISLWAMYCGAKAYVKDAAPVPKLVQKTLFGDGGDGQKIGTDFSKLLRAVYILLLLRHIWWDPQVPTAGFTLARKSRLYGGKFSRFVIRWHLRPLRSVTMLPLLLLVLAPSTLQGKPQPLNGLQGLGWVTPWGVAQEMKVCCIGGLMGGTSRAGVARGKTPNIFKCLNSKIWSEVKS